MTIRFPRGLVYLKVNNSTYLIPGCISNSTLFFSSLLEKIEKIIPGIQEKSSNDLTIILADDDADDREMFEEAIVRVNPSLKVSTVPDGNSLLSVLRSGKLPLMIFLDLNMPGKNGKECLQEIRKNTEWQKIPIVIYSTSASNRDIQDTFNSGASRYLLKPNSFKELINMIKHVFTMDLDRDTIEPQEYLVTLNA